MISENGNTSVSIEIAEIDGNEVGAILRYYDLKAGEEMELDTCIGDITVIINALEDYASILEQAIVEWELDGWHKASYETHAARCRKISEKYQAKTGYDYNLAIAKCKKRREKKDEGIGGDAMELALRPKVTKGGGDQ